MNRTTDDSEMARIWETEIHSYSLQLATATIDILFWHAFLGAFIIKFSLKHYFLNFELNVLYVVVCRPHIFKIKSYLYIVIKYKC